MDSFELNKIIGAILGTLLFVMGVGFLAEAIYHPIEGRGPGYALPVLETAEGGAGEEGETQVADLGTLLASADPAAGEAAARKCTGCHNFAEGAGNKQGPELWAVVDRLIGAHEGFAYSPAMLEHKDKGDLWSYANLDAFLASPKGFTPGTKMAFPGIKDATERANVLAYLGSLSASPVPFPAPESAAPADAPAGETEAPAEAAAPADAAGDVVPAVPAEEPAAPAEAPSVETPATEPNAVETPTETQSETPVQGTPAPSEAQPATP